MTRCESDSSEVESEANNNYFCASSFGGETRTVGVRKKNGKEIEFMNKFMY